MPGHRHKLSQGVEFVTVMRDRVFKTGLGVGRISAPYLLRNVHRPFFSDVPNLSFSGPLPCRLFFPSSGATAPNCGGIIYIRSFQTNFFLRSPFRGDVRNVRGYPLFTDIEWFIDPLRERSFRRRSRLPSIALRIVLGFLRSYDLMRRDTKFFRGSRAMRISAKRFNDAIPFLVLPRKCTPHVTLVGGFVHGGWS